MKYSSKTLATQHHANSIPEMTSDDPSSQLKRLNYEIIKSKEGEAENFGHFGEKFG